MENMDIKTLSFKNKKFLITGNTGFVGGWLSLILNHLGAEVFGISKKMTNKNYLSNTIDFKKNIQTHYLDIKNTKIIKKKIIIFKPEFVIHLASQPLVSMGYKNLKETFETNVMGSINFFEEIKNIKSIKKRIIFTSDKVYLEKKKKLSEIDNLGGNDPYSASKVCQDIISNLFGKRFFKNKKTTIIRAGNILGGGDWGKDRLIIDLIQAFKQKKTLKIRNPNAIRPWQHIFDIIYSILLILKNKQKKNLEIFNIASNSDSHIRVKELLNIIKKNYKKFNFKVIKSKFYESQYLKLNSNKFKSKFNFKSGLKIKDCIEKTIDWYKNCYIDNKKINIYEYSKNQFISYLKNK